jgi:pyridoxine kinase
VHNVLTIQSAVAYGHAGNSSAVFPLMRLGVETWPVYTVLFSNNTSYGAWRGPYVPPKDIAEVVKGVDERGALEHCDAVLSGYQGDAATGAEILKAVELVKSRNPKAIYCCDPVIGDFGRGVYVVEGIPEYIRDHVVPAADILTPNHFELNLLTGIEATTLPEILEAVARLRAQGPSVVLVTSANVEGESQESVTMVAVSDEGAWQVTTPQLRREFTGSGDVTTAIFLAHYLDTDVPTALSRTADSMYGILKRTFEDDSRELEIVAAQDELVSPSQHFEVVDISSLL